MKPQEDRTVQNLLCAHLLIFGWLWVSLNSLIRTRVEWCLGCYTSVDGSLRQWCPSSAPGMIGFLCYKQRGPTFRSGQRPHATSSNGHDCTYLTHQGRVVKCSWTISRIRGGWPSMVKCSEMLGLFTHLFDPSYSTPPPHPCA